ncbi:MAG: hypothetical protein E7370_04190 [Clostridiales bacterium]|nr:hypothetical protein [Clostridiales bacterium]
MNSKTNSNNFIRVICIILVAALAFGLGFITAKLIKSPSAKSFEWVVNTINDYYYYDVDEDYLISCAMDGGVEKALDQYSEYYTKEEYAEVLSSNSGSKAGVGISFSFIENKGVLLNTVIGNSPAYISGLRRGTIIVSGVDKNGREKTFISANDFSSFIASFSLGEEIHLCDDGGTVYSVAKSEYTASYAMLCTNQTAWGFTASSNGSLALKEFRDERLSYLPDGSAYLSLSQFYGTVSWEVSKLMEKFSAQSCTSLILDLRGNGGGYLSDMQELTYIFTADRKPDVSLVAYAEYKDGSRQNFNAIKKREYNLLPKEAEVFVLANENSASASEALMGALISYEVIDYSSIYLSNYSNEYIKWMADQGYGVKNGSTYGKGIMQSTFNNLSTGEALKLTTAKIYWPNGKSIHGVGITAADGCNTVSAQWSVTLHDEELQLAVNNIYQ